TRANAITSVGGLTAGAKIGTSSLRRVAQIRYLRPDLEVVPLRGNVPTRVQKVRDGRDGLDAALLAAAGLERLELADRIAVRLDPLEVMPTPGQGALGLEVRADDRAVRALLAPHEHAPRGRAGGAERRRPRARGGGRSSCGRASCAPASAGAGKCRRSPACTRPRGRRSCSTRSAPGGADSAGSSCSACPKPRTRPARRPTTSRGSCSRRCGR